MRKFLFFFLSIIVITGVGVATYFFYFTPQPTAKRIADKIISSASSNNIDLIRKYGSTDNLNKFVTSSQQRNFRYISVNQEGQIFYFLYEFTDSQSPKKARIAIENNKISSLAIGDGIAGLPKDDKEITSIKNESLDHCLSKSDLQYLDSDKLYAKNFRAATMIFVPNGSLDYSGEANGNKLLDRIANFYKKTSTKDYQFVISGYAPAPEKYRQAYDDQVQLSNNRATKINNDLIKREISRDRITIKDPTVYNQSYPDIQDNYINIDVVNNCL